MTLNDFSWLSVLQKDKNLLIRAGVKTRHHQTITKLDPPIEIYYPPTYFPSKAFFFVGFNLWIFEARLVTICYKYLCVRFFLHHDSICLSGTILKLVCRWWGWYRNSPVPIPRTNSLGRSERGEEGIHWDKVRRIHHSSSVPLASDCSWDEGR